MTGKVCRWNADTADPDNARPSQIGGASMGSTEEPNRKRRLLNNNNHSVKKLSITPSSDEKKVDAQTLQFQNQQLEIKCDVQRSEIFALEGKLNQLRSKQTSYDENLSIVNRVWDQVVDDLESLTGRASAATNETLASKVCSSERKNASKDAFLQRLLDKGATESSTTSNGSDGSLCSRKASAAQTIKFLVQSVDSERSRNDELVSAFRSGLNAKGKIRSLVKAGEELHVEAKRMRTLLDDLHVSHRELSAEVGTCHDMQAKDRAEVKSLTGELLEAHADLEASQRQLAALRSQDVTPTPTGKCSEVENGVVARESFSGANFHLEAGLEEAKTLAALRLTELQEALQNHLDVIQKIQQMQDELDEQEYILVPAPRILSSRQYQLLNEQVQELRDEVEKCLAMVDQLQAENISLLRREKDVTLKAEAGDAARRVSTISDSRAADMELRLQQCMSDCDNLQLRVEDATQATARKESVADLKNLLFTLHKEMSMIQAQSLEFKEEGAPVHSLRAELYSLRAILDRKTVESRRLSHQCLVKAGEIGTLQDQVKVLRGNQRELKLVLEMFDRESKEPREVRGLQQAEWRAWAEIERLQSALSERNLQLKVKAANEAQVACQHKLTAVEAEIAELRNNLDISFRVALDLRATVKAYKNDGDAYISEIEDIGQAYEDVQGQNQRLLQEIMERDDYNAQLMSESLQAKQLQNSVQAEKQVLNAQMQHANAASDLHKQRVVRLEEQARSFNDQLGKATDDKRQQSSAEESAKRKAAETEKELTSAKLALESAHKVLKDRGQKFLNVTLQLEKERFEKRRVEDELEVLSVETGRLHSHHDGGVKADRLRQEIKEYKSILKCSVCRERPKDVVITKCYHLFCSPCVQQNLEHKHRKCPSCGIQYGQDDVRTVYI